MKRRCRLHAVRPAALLLGTVLSSADVLAISATMTVNNGATCTASSDGVVVLNNTVSGGTPTQYRASESQSGLANATWQNYNATPSFTLSSSAGSKTIYFQVRGTQQNTTVDSAVVSDRIDRIARTDSLTLRVNSGSDRTTNRTVTLNNTASLNPAGTGMVYAASEDPSYFPAWQPYGTAPQFLLSEGPGTKTVYLAVGRTLCGEVYGPAPASDTISFVIRHEFTGSTNPRLADVIAYAHDRGFTRSTTKFGTGSCKRSVGSRMLADREQSLYVWPELTCTWSAFGGRKLNAGWRTVSVAIDGDGIFSKIMMPNSDDASFAVRVALPREISGSAYECEAEGLNIGDGCSTVTRLVIEGPSSNWQDAFR